MVWTILLEILGLAATCGPLAFHFDPPIGGVLYFWQNDTLRVPRTRTTSCSPRATGARRGTPVYKLIVFWLILMMFLSGEQVPGFRRIGRHLPQWSLVVYAA